LHGIFYGIFCLFWLRILRHFSKVKRYRYALGVVFLYSLSDEIHQYYVPTRSFQLMDLLIDNLGSFLGIFFVSWFLPRAPIRIKNWAKKLDLA